MTGAPTLAAELWTSSRLAAVQRCLRLHHYRYELGIGDAPSDVARFGTVGHAALEAWLCTLQADPADADGATAAALAAVVELEDVYERARLRAVITGYLVRWGGVRWQVLAVEMEFTYQLGAEIIAGKIDAIVLVLEGEDAGRCYVVEHKFTKMDAAPGSTYWERLTIDQQVSIYVDGARTAGYDVQGVIYDVIAKPGHEPARATPPELRKYTKPIETKGKGCPTCGGRVGGKDGPLVGTGTLDGRPCPACAGTGWREPPKSEPARLYANQRDADETPEAFEARVVEAIAASPDSYYRRGVIVRLNDELPAMRADILDTIKLARLSSLLELRPRSTGACAKFGTLCHFFPLCSGQSTLEDEARWPRGRAHAELTALTTTP